MSKSTRKRLILVGLVLLPALLSVWLALPVRRDTPPGGAVVYVFDGEVYTGHELSLDQIRQSEGLRYDQAIASYPPAADSDFSVRSIGPRILFYYVVMVLGESEWGELEWAAHDEKFGYRRE